MMDLLLVFIGAGLGGSARYGIANACALLFGQNFPYGTLTVNVIGSLLAGFLYTLLLEDVDIIATHIRPLLLIGFLGGFTTFSTFSLETITLIENGAWIESASNIILNLVLCLMMAWLGIIVGRQL